MEWLKGAGIFLLGMGILIIAIVLAVSVPKAESYYREPFYAYCTNGYVKIVPHIELHNVKIIADNKTICSYDKILYPKVCYVGNKSIVVIKSDEGEDVLECWNEIISRTVEKVD